MSPRNDPRSQSPRGSYVSGAPRKPVVIGLIEGHLTDRELHKDGTATVLVNVNGVGYELAISARHFQVLPPLDAATSMRVHTHVREGSITLYGFQNRDERALFDLLLSAHGVG